MQTVRLDVGGKVGERRLVHHRENVSERMEAPLFSVRSRLPLEAICLSKGMAAFHAAFERHAAGRECRPGFSTVA